MAKKITEHEKALKFKKAEVAQLNRCRKSYHFQSEWHRLMYALTLEIEILQRLLNK